MNKLRNVKNGCDFKINSAKKLFDCNYKTSEKDHSRTRGKEKYYLVFRAEKKYLMEKLINKCSINYATNNPFMICRHEESKCIITIFFQIEPFFYHYELN